MEAERQNERAARHARLVPAPAHGRVALLARRAGAEIVAQHEITDLLLGAAIRTEHAVEAQLQVLGEAQLHPRTHSNQMIRIARWPLTVAWL